MSREKELEDPVAMTVFVEREMRDSIPHGERSREVREALAARVTMRGDWKKNIVRKDGRLPGGGYQPVAEHSPRNVVPSNGGTGTKR